MKHSNLALRLDEFEELNQLREESRQGLAAAIASPDPVRARPRRLTLTTRRILIRDPALRQFRVF